MNPATLGLFDVYASQCSGHTMPCMVPHNHNGRLTRRDTAPLPQPAAILEDGSLVELLYDRRARRTSLAVWRNQACDSCTRLELPSGERLVPYSPENNLIKNKAILLPSGPEEYGSEAELVAEIQAYIHRYVDLSPQLERIASYYVLSLDYTTASTSSRTFVCGATTAAAKHAFSSWSALFATSQCSPLAPPPYRRYSIFSMPSGARSSSTKGISVGAMTRPKSSRSSTMETTVARR